MEVVASRCQMSTFQKRSFYSWLSQLTWTCSNWLSYMYHVVGSYINPPIAFLNAVCTTLGRHVTCLVTRLSSVHSFSNLKWHFLGGESGDPSLMRTYHLLWWPQVPPESLGYFFPNSLGEVQHLEWVWRLMTGPGSVSLSRSTLLIEGLCMGVAGLCAFISCSSSVLANN